MVYITYLGKTIELTPREYEKIMVQCPNLKYKTKSGFIVKGSDSRLVQKPPPIVTPPCTAGSSATMDTREWNMGCNDPNLLYHSG